MLLAAIIILLIVLIMLRVPVSFAIFGAGALGLLATGGFDILLPVMATAPATAVRSTSLTTIPLFMLMAQFMVMSGLLDSLFDAARGLVGRVPGGTAVASVGTLAAMVPPSIILVFYAITAEAPVGDVLVSGFFPGILIAITMIATMYLGSMLRGGGIPMGNRFTMSEKLHAFGQASPLIIVFVAVVGSIFFGLATPTESAAVGALAALLLVLVRRRFTLRGMGECLEEPVKSTAMILAIIMAAHVFGHFLTDTRAAPRRVAVIEESALPALVVMGLIAAFYVVLGFFMDQIAVIALTVPIVLLVVEGLGYDPVWFGIFMVLLAEVGMITPPMGIKVFVVAKSAEMPPMTVFRGAFPYVVAVLVMAAIFLFWPQLLLWVLALM